MSTQVVQIITQIFIGAMNVTTRSAIHKALVQPFYKHNCVSNLARISHLHRKSIQSERKDTELKPLGHGIVLVRSNMHTQHENIFKRVYNKVFDKIFSLDSGKQKFNGYLWYGTLDQVNHAEFFKFLNMPDTFVSWFKVNELHVWMLLCRMMQEGNSLRHTRTSLIEAMWVDVEKRAKLVEPLNKNYKQNMRTLSSMFNVTLFTYDEGYLSSDIMFANALWDNFFEQQCEDPRNLEILISYIRKQIEILQLISIVGFTPSADKTQQIWTSLEPHCKKVMSLS